MSKKQNERKENNMKRFLRKINVFLILIICTVCLSGCVRFNTTINVKSNGKLDVSMLYAAMDMSDYGYDSDSFTEEQKKEYIDQGWDVEDYSQDGFNGVLISKSDITVDELTSSIKNTQSELSEEAGTLSFNKQGLQYTFDWQVFDKAEGEQITAYKNYFTMSGGYMNFKVTLPVKPSVHNATSVSNDGKTLEWDLLDLGPEQNIHLEFTLINIKLIILIIVFITIIGIIIWSIAIAWVIKTNKQKRLQIEMVNNQRTNQ